MFASLTRSSLVAAVVLVRFRLLLTTGAQLAEHRQTGEERRATASSTRTRMAVRLQLTS